VDRLVELLKRLEGRRLKAYQDTRGYWTVGYGWRIKDPELRAALDLGEPFEISQSLADTLLTIACSLARLNARTIYPDLDGYPEARRDALVCLAYQLGKEGLDAFVKMQQAILSEDWQGAARELIDSKLHEQTPNRAWELAHMLETGEYLPY